MTAAPPAADVLLLSGGLDSAAVAAWTRPTQTLFVDYGQRPAAAEARAAAAVAAQLGLPHAQVTVDASAVGAGLLSAAGQASAAKGSPEWWPFRNQLLVTIAAAWVMSPAGGAEGRSVGLAERVTVGTVRGDGARHADGTAGFFAALDALLSVQEGGLRCSAPGLNLSTADLIAASGIGDDVIGWTHSCHTSTLPCSDCPGCWKREQVLDRLSLQ